MNEAKRDGATSKFNQQSIKFNWKWIWIDLFDLNLMGAPADATNKSNSIKINWILFVAWLAASAISHNSNFSSSIDFMALNEINEGEVSLGRL